MSLMKNLDVMNENGHNVVQWERHRLWSLTDLQLNLNELLFVLE